MTQLGYKTTSELIFENIVFFNTSDFDRVYVAERDNEIIGVISCHIISLFHQTGFCGRITSLVVSELARGEKVGELFQREELFKV